LKSSSDPVERKLSPQLGQQLQLSKRSLDEKQFRWELNENAMATEKLSEGIRTFGADAVKLEQYIEKF